MKSNKIIVILALVLLVLCGQSFPRNIDTAQLTGALQTRLDVLTANKDIPGVTFAVVLPEA